jgi:hypothetical protein
MHFQQLETKVGDLFASEETAVKDEVAKVEASLAALDHGKNPISPLTPTAATAAAAAAPARDAAPAAAAAPSTAQAADAAVSTAAPGIVPQQ